jgi:hypothetical protein
MGSLQGGNSPASGDDGETGRSVASDRFGRSNATDEPGSQGAARERDPRGGHGRGPPADRSLAISGRRTFWSGASSAGRGGLRRGGGGLRAVRFVAVADFAVAGAFFRSVGSAAARLCCDWRGARPHLLRRLGLGGGRASRALRWSSPCGPSSGGVSFDAVSLDRAATSSPDRVTFEIVSVTALTASVALSIRPRRPAMRSRRRRGSGVRASARPSPYRRSPSSPGVRLI